MKFRRKNRDQLQSPSIATSGTTSSVFPDSAPIAPPNPLVAIRGRLSTRLQYLDNSIARFDQDKLTMQQEMESLQKEIHEIDRVMLATPIMEKLRELYR